MSGPPVLVCVPAFRGAEVIGETLRAILRQSVPGLRCHVSVDGGDAETAEACRPFLADPRLRLTVQPRRLGWAGNLNALWAEAREGYAMYWQQDDMADDRYLERLLAALEAAPGAAVAYADVQWFGARSEREEFPSVLGRPLERAAFMAEAQHYLPFRGLVRASALRKAGPLRLTPYDSALENLVQVTRFARVGELLRVPGPIYLKRAHAASVHRGHLSKPAAQRRGTGVLHAAGMLEAVLAAAPDEATAQRIARALLPRFLRTAPARLLDRAARRLARRWPALAGPRMAALRRRLPAPIRPEPARWLIYDPAAEAPADVPRFAFEAAREAARASGRPSVAALLGRLRPDAADPDAALLAEALRREAWREGLQARLRAEGGARIALAETPEADALLSAGWSGREAWGVWSEAEAAVLDLPLPEGRWRLGLRLSPFAAAGPQRLRLCRGEETLAEARLTEEREIEAELAAGAEPARLELRLPDGASPASLGLGADARRLSVGLLGLSLLRL
ncbi:MAG: glycosyltransferase [Acetobacteraceae bacterium]|nr:glycosyltransferase [Acetobacteraceae bacterium]